MATRRKSVKTSRRPRPAVPVALKQALQERDEALRFQAAIADILAALSRSRESPQPVFDAIVRNVLRLFDTRYAVVFLIEGDQLHLAALHGDQRFSAPGSEAAQRFVQSFPQPVDWTTFTGQAMQAGEVRQLTPIIGNPQASPRAVQLARTFGYNSMVTAPLVLDGRVVGTIGTNHSQARRYSERELAALKAFADQAVVAIENARLFNETKEALERQTATAEILKVISRSPTDTQPVFDAIVKSCFSLFEVGRVTLWLRAGEELEVRARESATQEKAGAYTRTPLDRQSGVGQCVLESRVVHLPDMAQVTGQLPRARQLGLSLDYRAALFAPLVREGAALGAISLLRAEPGPFAEKEIALLQTFADQAVIAIENVRLFNETKDSLGQQTAIAEVLRVISGSPADVRPVLDAVAERALRICESYDVRTFLVVPEGLRYVAGKGSVEMFPTGTVRPLTRGLVMGRAVLERRAIQVADLSSEMNEYPDGVEVARRFGHRTTLAVPLLREDRALGVLLLRRLEVRPFTEKQVQLLKTFAHQAAIAIENVRLFNETREALERQTATSDILKVISSTPTDTQPVFDAIVAATQRLIGGKSTVLLLRDGTDFVVAGYSGSMSELPDEVKRARLDPAVNFPSRVIVHGELVHTPDLSADDVPEFEKAVGRAYGIKAGLLVPLLRKGQGIGAIAVTRATAGRFTDEEVALLQSFADQAVIAIENTRLFNETREALERQTASAEILRVISSTPTDTMPVFEAIVQSAQRLMGGASAALLLRRETQFWVAAYSAPGLENVPADVRTAPLDRDKNFPSRVILDGEVLRIPDWQGEGVPEHEKTVARSFGVGSGLQVPLLRDGKGVGALVVTRRARGDFQAKEVALLQSFADQAVIAIENTRLFNELQSTNATLREALEQQTATSDILKVISSSPTDVQPVFEAIVKSAVRLCNGRFGALFTYDGRMMDLAAQVQPSEEVREMFARAFPQPIVPNTPSAQAILERKVVNVADMQTHPDYAEDVHERARVGGYRAVLTVPMMRGDTPIGAIAVTRPDAAAFDDTYVALLQTFADQAVIAIENVRLFNETKQALERQTATSEILKVISSSTTDTQPVFEAIVRSAARLFPMTNASIFMRDGELMRLHAVEGATVDSTMRRELGGIYPIRFDPEVSTSARAMVERRINICLDTEAPDVPEHIRRAGRAGRFRSNTVVPLVREDAGIGSIVITHPQPGHRLNDEQLALLRTFADQAVIAIENTRLFNETREALEQQTATSEVLKVISRTQFDLEPVLNIVMDNALNLCEADRVVIFRADAEGRYRPAATRVRDERSALLELFRDRPILPDSSSATGRAVSERRTVHIPDVRLDPTYGRADLADASGYRSILAVPMLREGAPIGVLTVARTGEPRPFAAKQIDLVTTFADQAVIAIENVRLFREIQEKSAQLEVANRHKSEFLANMSHELRTPLNAIIGFSEVLTERMFGELNDKQADYLKDIHESGRHLLSLINDILDLSKIEAGRMELELATFDLPSAISNAMTLVRERAQRHGVQLGAQLDPRLGEWRADERKVKQILLNLLSNAVKFTPDGGRVDVIAKLDTDQVEIAVRDTGVGIAPEDQAKLFEEFSQVGRDGARKAEGTGLGLALTRKFVELHGGAIRVESAPGAGATFLFSLPLARAGSPASSG